MIYGRVSMFGISTFVNTHFNSIVLTYHDQFQWMSMTSQGCAVSFSHSLATAHITWLCNQLLPFSCYCTHHMAVQSASPILLLLHTSHGCAVSFSHSLATAHITLSSVHLFHCVRLTAFKLHAMRLSFHHLMFFIYPSTVCSLAETDFHAFWGYYISILGIS